MTVVGKGGDLWSTDSIPQFLRLCFVFVNGSEFMNHSAQSFKGLDATDTGKVSWTLYVTVLTSLSTSKWKEFAYATRICTKHMYIEDA
jgi:hypothetical protein